MTPFFLGKEEKRTLPINYDGSCISYLGDACISAINANVKALNSSSDNYCSDYSNAIKRAISIDNSPCPNLGLLAQQFPTFPLPPTASADVCPIKGSDDKSSLLIYNNPAQYLELHDLNSEAYDPAVGISMPLFLSVRPTDDDGAGFTDDNTRMVCIPANNVVTRSRTLGGAALPAASSTNKPGAAGRVEMSSVLFALVGWRNCVDRRICGVS